MVSSNLKVFLAAVGGGGGRARGAGGRAWRVGGGLGAANTTWVDHSSTVGNSAPPSAARVVARHALRVDEIQMQSDSTKRPQHDIVPGPSLIVTQISAQLETFKFFKTFKSLNPSSDFDQMSEG